MDETEIKNMNQLIEIAKSKKPCSRDTFLITLAINMIDKEEKKNGNNSHIKEITYVHYFFFLIYILIY